MQVEYVVPRADKPPLESDHWRDTWLEDTRRIGILDDAHQVEVFDFKTRPIHFNSFGMEGHPLKDADIAQLNGDSNIYPLQPSMANLNLNSYVPKTVDYVTSVLSRWRQ